MEQWEQATAVEKPLTCELIKDHIQTQIVPLVNLLIINLLRPDIDQPLVPCTFILAKDVCGRVTDAIGLNWTQ